MTELALIPTQYEPKLPHTLCDEVGGLTLAFSFDEETEMLKVEKSSICLRGRPDKESIPQGLKPRLVAAFRMPRLKPWPT
jgi:hypothetical protein